MPVQVRKLNLKLIKWTQMRVTTLACQEANNSKKNGDNNLKGHFYCTALSVQSRSHPSEVNPVPPPLLELLISNPRPSLTLRQPKPTSVFSFDPCLQGSTNLHSTQHLTPKVQPLAPTVQTLAPAVRHPRSFPPSPSSLLHILDPASSSTLGTLDTTPRSQHVFIGKGGNSLIDFNSRLWDETGTALPLGVDRLRIAPCHEGRPLTATITQTRAVRSDQRLDSLGYRYSCPPTIYSCVKPNSSELTCNPQSNENSPTPPSEGKGPTEGQLLQVKEQLIKVVPVFFKKPHNYRMYNPNLVFINNFWGKEAVIRGLPAYMMELSKTRVFSHIKYAHLQMNIVKITIHPDEGCVRVHWRVTGLPQLKTLQFWKFLPWTYRNSLKTESQFFDGFSTFFIGCDELIYKHRVDRLMPTEEPLSSEKRPVLAHKLGLLFGLLPRTGF